MARGYSSKGILLAVGIITAFLCFTMLIDLFSFSQRTPANIDTTLPAFRDVRWLELVEQL